MLKTLLFVSVLGQLVDYHGCFASREVCWSGDQCNICSGINIEDGGLCCPNCAQTNSLLISDGECFCGTDTAEDPTAAEPVPTTAWIVYRPCWSGGQCTECGSTWMQGGATVCCEDCGPTNYRFTYNNDCYCGKVNDGKRHSFIAMSFIFPLVALIYILRPF